MMMNTNDNTEGIEVEAPPVMYGEDDADSIEQLPNANDDVVLMNNLPNPRDASKQYIIGAIFVGIAGFAGFFGVGMGAGSGITNAVNKSANEAASVSSASSMAFTASTNGAKAGKVAKSIKTSTKSSTSKSGKSVTTTTSTTPATTTTPPVINDYTIAGSTDPVVGPSILNDYCTETLGLDPLTDQLAFGACLTTRLAGPVIISDFGSVPDPTRFWYFNKDVPFASTAACNTASPPCTESASFVFEGDEVCAVISEDNLESKTRFELWDAQYLGMPLGEFVEFSVDYELVSRADVAGATFRSDGFANVYLRADTNNTAFYDCRLNYYLDITSPDDTITITPTTVADNSAVWAGSSTSPAGAGCDGALTIEDYLSANSGAVLGAGNGELYAFTLDTGSTNQNDNGLEVCWSDVSITTDDGSGGATQIDNYAFGVLPPPTCDELTTVDADASVWSSSYVSPNDCETGGGEGNDSCQCAFNALGVTNPGCSEVPIGGSGQCQGQFTLLQEDGVEVGIRATKRGPNGGPITPMSSATAGVSATYNVDVGLESGSTTRASWNFDLHVDLRGATNGLLTLGDYGLNLTVDCTAGNCGTFGSYIVPFNGNPFVPDALELYQTSQNFLFDFWPWRPSSAANGLIGDGSYDVNAEATYKLCLNLGNLCPVCMEVNVGSAGTVNQDDCGN